MVFSKICFPFFRWLAGWLVGVVLNSFCKLQIFALLAGWLELFGEIGREGSERNKKIIPPESIEPAE